ncbi:hypothetical protein GGX14DRAFT_577157 [Mycena pura]|uniref:Uncharacterized protein n=1 Tax=Mycena pura TaxID=153505 RepID=A0AAD6Y0J5_9AGAR|nr:hypothetical protein GGX14DRAFT_577157 [Mycena pura]
MPPRGSQRRSLHDFQQLAGWVIWALNVCPLLWPGLSAVYDKTRGKIRSNGKISISKAAVRDLSWFAAHLKRSDGVQLLEELDWDPCDAEVTVFCDASLLGLGFFFDGCSMAFQARPPSAALQNSLALEALCVCWALHEVERLLMPVFKMVVIWTDSLDTVDIFSSLSAKPLYNEILKSAVDVLIRTNLKLHVCHIEGRKNIVTDALSRYLNDTAHKACPGLYIDDSQAPPSLHWPTAAPPKRRLRSARRVVPHNVHIIPPSSG